MSSVWHSSSCCVMMGRYGPCLFSVFFIYSAKSSGHPPKGTCCIWAILLECPACPGEAHSDTPSCCLSLDSFGLYLPCWFVAEPLWYITLCNNMTCTFWCENVHIQTEKKTSVFLYFKYLSKSPWFWSGHKAQILTLSWNHFCKGFYVNKSLYLHGGVDATPLWL